MQQLPVLRPGDPVPAHRQCEVHVSSVVFGPLCIALFTMSCPLPVIVIVSADGVVSVAIVT
jgi:hypothetical protein